MYNALICTNDEIPARLAIIYRYHRNHATIIIPIKTPWRGKVRLHESGLIVGLKLVGVELRSWLMVELRTSNEFHLQMELSCNSA